ncbi:MAG: hypothetical protein MRY32_03235 [Rickettsiales bacterium]|nr:hypothetical protein [Rickettsiales bacterium]
MRIEWYGLATLFIEIPRRFLISLWTIPSFYMILPFGFSDSLAVSWPLYAITASAIIADILLSWRAPDVHIQLDAIQQKLTNSEKNVVYLSLDIARAKVNDTQALRRLQESGDRLYYTSWEELKQRLYVITAGACLMSLVVWHWSSTGKTFVLESQLLVAAIVSLVIAFISYKGMPLRYQEELPEGHSPFLADWCSTPTKYVIIRMFGIPLFFIWVFAGLFYSFIGAFDGWEGSPLFFLYGIIACYLIVMLCIQFLIVVVLERKMNAVYRVLHPDTGKEHNVSKLRLTFYILLVLMAGIIGLKK